MAARVSERCSTCGEELQPGDHFCGSCGAAVQPDQAGGPTAYEPFPRRRTGRTVVAVIAGFVVVAAVSGLVVAFLDARRDVDAERRKAAAAQTQVVALTEELAATADPDASLQQQLAAAQAELDDTTAQLTESQTELTAERDARAADATAAEAAKATEIAAVQTQLDAVNAQLAALQAVYPLSEDTFRSASPAGEYAVTIQPLGCTILECLELRSLQLSFPDATKVSGNRANGIIAFEDGSYTASGPLAAEQSPLCKGLETTATFALEFHASRVAFENGLLTAVENIGTYSETIVGGECAGQSRSYSLSMVKQ